MSDRPHRTFLIAQVSWFFGIAAAVTLITLGSMWNQQRNHNDKIKDRNRVIYQNDFWRQLTGSPLKVDTARGRLARDLRPFLEEASLKETAAGSGLIPKTLEEVSVPEDKYDGISGELGFQYVFEGTSSDNDAGTFMPSFLGKFEQARNRRLPQLIKPVPEKPELRYTATFMAVPFIPYLIGWWLFLSIATFGITKMNLSASYQWSSDHRYRNWRLNGKETPQKLASMLLALPLFLVWWLARVPVAIFVGFANRIERISNRRDEREKINQHPFGTELQRARVNLQRLRELPQTPEVKRAIKDTESLVTELEGVPLQISKSGAKVIAAEILRDNKDIRDRPKALLAAREEIDYDEYH